MYSHAYVLLAGSSVQPLDVSAGDEAARLGGDEDGRLSLTASKNLLHHLEIGGSTHHQLLLKIGGGEGEEGWTNLHKFSGEFFRKYIDL